MRKNNWWNRIFHKVEIAINQKDADLQTSLYERKDEVLKNLAQCETLTEILTFHKQIWKDGYRNRNIGPDKYGMFRTENIENMTPDEVYLGNIHGLWTNNITYWINNMDNYDIVLNQYKIHLESNIIAIAKEAKRAIDEYVKAGYVSSL